ncbi:DUF3833 family protein [Aquisalinus flavus]|uniref:DUF3833 domain-containing protein n=1 Tax=Aquisalinus flavus TaxID=1526572 RepID=A0A8J2V4W2_9PROT|nr:DUF3833 family protein [Aquisalinus flavus]MBD0425719.1 DUF3833 family protein [Aquisalinus flavus]UNE48671.1 DUF3833 domain-containing protein [Aquisalinus flavus]GGD13817.1 hypothetical protein GCM10011342_23220 [Aquisalinus flavus]
MKHRVTLLLILAMTAACEQPPANPLDSGDTAPIDIARDLQGAFIANARFTAVNGTDTEFSARMSGRMKDDTLIYVEDFTYEDGREERQTWHLTKLTDGTWLGSRENVIGEARGWQDGPAFRLSYTGHLQGSEEGEGMTASFEHVIVKRRDGVIVNVVSVGKYGIGIGKAVMTIVPVDDTASAD